MIRGRIRAGQSAADAAAAARATLGAASFPSRDSKSRGLPSLNYDHAGREPSPLRPAMLEPMSPEAIDLCLVGGDIVDVQAGATRRAAVGIHGDRIVAIGADAQIAPRARQVADVAGQTIVPGYIEPHGHVILANPVEFAGAVLPGGTTMAVTDTLPLMLLARPDRLAGLLEQLAGLETMLRHSSIRPDLPDLLRAVPREEIASGRVMLTADGPTPAFIADRGYLDHLLAVAISAGISPIDALRMVPVNPARYYGIQEAAPIAVGYRADVNVIPDLSHMTP